MKTTRITIEVGHPDDVDLSQVAGAINQMLSSGLDDVMDQLKDPELATGNEYLQVAGSLEIGVPVAEAVDG